MDRAAHPPAYLVRPPKGLQMPSMTTFIVIAKKDYEHVAWMSSSPTIVDWITTLTLKLVGIKWVEQKHFAEKMQV